MKNKKEMKIEISKLINHNSDRFISIKGYNNLNILNKIKKMIK